MNSITFAQTIAHKLRQWRRDFHRYPESGWHEYRTAAIVATLLEELGFEIEAGPSVVASESRMGLPTTEHMEKEMERALAQGANPKWVEAMAYGHTGLVATLHCHKESPTPEDSSAIAPGPTIAFRFDLDAVDVDETKEEHHVPVKEGFASTHPHCMHACGHDGHLAIGLGLASYIKALQTLYEGTFKLIFQPAEEGVRGARAMRDAGVVDDVDYLFCLHLGLDPALADDLVCMNTGFLATSKYDAQFHGRAAHGGNAPEMGQNALLASATAALQLHALPRHSQGPSRINVGVLEAGTGRNVIAEHALLKLETRGATTAINTFMEEQTEQVLQAAAAMYHTTVEITKVGSAPSMKLCEPLAHEIAKVADTLYWPAPATTEGIFLGASAAQQQPLFSTIYLSYENSCSEDATYLINRVLERGGFATYMILGSPLCAPHHNGAFDFEEKTLVKGVALLGALAEHSLVSPLKETTPTPKTLTSLEKSESGPTLEATNTPTNAGTSRIVQGSLPGPHYYRRNQKRILPAFIGLTKNAQLTLRPVTTLAIAPSISLLGDDTSISSSPRPAFQAPSAEAFQKLRKNALALQAQTILQLPSVALDTLAQGTLLYEEELTPQNTIVKDAPPIINTESQRHCSTLVQLHYEGTPLQEPSEYPQYDDYDAECIVNHYLRHFGHPQSVKNGLSIPGLTNPSPLQVLLYEPIPTRNYYILATIGLGAYKMQVPKAYEREAVERLELVSYLSPNWDMTSTEPEWTWPLRLLFEYAKLPITQQSWMGWGHLIQDPAPYAENTKLMSSLLLLPSGVPDSMYHCRLCAGEIVNFLQPYPLYQEEVYYKALHSTKDLLSKLERLRVPPYIDRQRINTCTQTIQVN